MLSLQLDNLFKVGRASGLARPAFEGQKKHLAAYLKKIAAHERGFYSAIDDSYTQEKIERFSKKNHRRYRDIVVLGIGGSALGTICLTRALTHLYSHELSLRRLARLHVLDNVDPAQIREIQDAIDLKRTLFVVVSKSGGTPETLSQYFYFRNLVQKSGLKRHRHFVHVTDPVRGFLRQIADEDGIASFGVPEDVGGRFSVLTAVGLLPAALVGITIRDILRGARDMRASFLSTSFRKNLPFQLAAAQYLLAKKGRDINVLMPYAQKLESLADWYRQLLAESIGKGGRGITPVGALGVTDQHSQIQLYMDGPPDKLVMFLEPQDRGKRLFIPNPYPKEETTAFLKKTTFADLMHAEKRATEMALGEAGHPSLTIEIGRVDAYHLGELFMFFEGATAFLGEFFGINAFDQPGVERGKKLTKKLLAKKG